MQGDQSLRVVAVTCVSTSLASPNGLCLDVSRSGYLEIEHGLRHVLMYAPSPARIQHIECWLVLGLGVELWVEVLGPPFCDEMSIECRRRKRGCSCRSGKEIGELVGLGAGQQ